MACTGSERQNRDIENDINLIVLRWSYFAMETKQKQSAQRIICHMDLRILDAYNL